MGDWTWAVASPHLNSSDLEDYFRDKGIRHQRTVRYTPPVSYTHLTLPTIYSV